MPGTLYVVATPIGNLEDLTYRARRVLAEADAIACEDTRHTRVLLDHYGISKPLISLYEHNERARTPALLRRLRAGETIALVSDAGTPAISDPGFALMRAVLAAGFTVVPIPGPSALLAALTISGLPSDRFTFLGFLPKRSSQRRRALQDAGGLSTTLVLFEAPHRITTVLQDLRVILGDRRVALARELTKKFEDVFRGTLSEALAHLRTHPPRGEFTIVVEGATQERQPMRDSEEDLRGLLARGMRPKDAVAELVRATGIPRREAYSLLLRVQGKRA